jgi:formylglycine-generating enzyme required for sulfatase activity
MQGSGEAGAYRVNRGGSWSFVSAGTRVASRSMDPVAFRHGNLGLRLVRTIP